MVSATIIKPNLSKSISKTRYTVTASSWSASVNADGYYTYSVSLSPSFNTSYAPNIYLAGSTDSTAPTDTAKGQYAYVERCRLSGSTSLTLYAKTKPTSTFYIYVEGTNGSGSANIEGNVIQPNKASGGSGMTLLHTYTMSKTDFGAADASGRRAAEIKDTSLLNDLLNKQLYVEVYETNYFSYWQKYNVFSGGIIRKGYFVQNTMCAFAMYGDPSKYYSCVIEYNYTVYDHTKVIVRIMDSYYTNSMPSDSTIVINVYEMQ
jgi:hypothetical protein